MKIIVLGKPENKIEKERQADVKALSTQPEQYLQVREGEGEEGRKRRTISQ